MLPPPEIEERLRARFGESILGFEEQFGHSVVSVAPQSYRDLALYLRDDAELACDYLDFTAGVDFGEDGIEVVTHLYSIPRGHSVRIKVRCEAADPSCQTLSDIFAGANWHERETTEMFGVRFEGHPQPVKLLLSDGFEGHPLRKDFELMSREAKPWPGAVEVDEEVDE